MFFFQFFDVVKLAIIQKKIGYRLLDVKVGKKKRILLYFFATYGSVIETLGFFFGKTIFKHDKFVPFLFFQYIGIMNLGMQV